MELGLSGARVLVTGASRGIGRAIAEAFAAEGANLAICARNEGPLGEVARELGRRVRVLAKPVDVKSGPALEAFVERAAQEFSGLDVVVSNVSGGSARDETQWERAVATDLYPFVRLVRAARPHLEASNSASIVLISTTSAVDTSPPSGAGAYGAVKAALNHHASALARELAPGIRVNTVSPGPVEFPGGGWARRREQEPALYAAVRERIPFGRMADPAEVARAVVFLASPAAGYIVGANLTVDGGFLSRVDG
ncbi:SDR family NAD(P)-dependent oxidoreductase [Allonocardiopsis opalescens]|uniref:3-oxoacyl-[acyl-carrier protein] reductase n=1 Tax=Allonocardiopsis opalescens TaxID=1144618 RepID=A0A2T0Q4D6_9ACTN|nr:SDR family oxidoreductase [Allonocardiopsis opalescens]PRX98623.1 3-oxoacyl-[acyl-carrier protein] reductase [Allonocardiopsis opalescens]